MTSPRLLQWLAPMLAAASVHAGVLELDLVGGDAWTLEKPVTGTFAPQACDRIDVLTEGASIRANVQNQRFFARVPLEPGANLVTVSCKRSGVEQEHVVQQWHERLPDNPKVFVRTRTQDDVVHFDAHLTATAHHSPAPIRSYEWWASPANPAPLELHGSDAGSDALKRCDQAEVCASRLQARIAVTMPSKDGEYYVNVRAIDALDRRDEAAGAFRIKDGRASRVDVDVHRPAWVDAAIVYGIAPSLYRPPAFRSITARLDEIARLGATVLWLAPVTEAPDDDFGYALSDPFRVRSKYGSEADLRALIAAAHARGMRVIVDFVANHFSDQHPYYIDAQRHGNRSPYYDWFVRDSQGKAQHYFDWRNLKNLNYDHPEVQNYMLAAFSHWLREFRVDGFRVDASWAVMSRAPEFWARWRQEMKRIDADVFLLAEASARDHAQLAHSFDAAYDWTENLGVWAWQQSFGGNGKHADVSALRTAIEQSLARERDQPVFRFLDNNDTGARFITRHGVEQTKLASTLLFTLPGVPLIYNGEEVGAAFEPYAASGPIDWRDRHGLRAFYSRLVQIRRSYPALHARDLKFLQTDDRDVLAYERVGPSSVGSLVVVLNFDSHSRRVRLHSDLLDACEITDLSSGRLVPVERGELSLDAHAALIMQPGRC